MDINVLEANYLDAQHASDLIYLLDGYAEDPMGGGNGLSDSTKSNLVKELSKIPSAFSVLCYVNNKPAGLANCFYGFSTFKCKPLINIHDLAVDKDHRGLGISQYLLSKIEEVAKRNNCCKLTLEVLDGNRVAHNAYIKYGFSGYELDPSKGKAMFMEKVIES